MESPFARRRRRLRQEIDDEVQSHIDERVDHLIAHGMSPADARAEALRRFGDTEAGRAAIYREAALRPRLNIGDRMHDLWQDIRYVARGLIRTPAFTVGLVATLALGLGINSAVFRLADFVLFRPPAGVIKPNDLRWVESSITVGKGTPMKAPSASYPDAKTMLDSGAFSTAGAYIIQTQRDETGRDLTLNFIDGNYFNALGVQPAIGRVFSADEVTPGQKLPAAIVSNAFWRTRLNNAPLDSGVMITLGALRLPVIGVMPAGFTGLELDPADVWLPLGIGEHGRSTINGVEIPWYQSTMMRTVRLVGRIPAGANDDAVAGRLESAFKSATNAGVVRRITLHPVVPIGGSSRTQDANALLGQLTIVAVVILVIACANAINLLLARGLRRHQEIAIRMAIGASRSRVSRLLIIESVMLAVVGGVAASIAGLWTAESLRRLLFPDARWTSSTFDQRTLVFTAVITIGAGLIAGIAPALQATTPDLVTGLKNLRGRGGAKTRMTRVTLIVLQTALSLTLLIASGLVVRSLVRLNAVPMGFESRGLVTASVSSVMFGQAIPGQIDADEVAARLRANSTGVIQGVSVASAVPFGTMSTMDTRVIGSTYEPDGSRDSPRWAAVDTNYFSVMRTKAIEGRLINADDTAGSEPVTVINSAMARTYFSGPIPPNACVLGGGRPCMRIVGVVEDIRDTPNGGAAPMRFYIPVPQWTPQANQRAAGVIIRTSESDARTVAGQIKQMFPATQRGVTIEVIADRVDLALRPWHTATWLFSVLGVLALALACVGVYSVMSYIASERINELAIRVVLGATSGDILRLVIADGFKMTLIGAALGLVTAAIGGHYLGALLFGVSPFDPITYGLGVLALAAASVVAVLPPATRASRVDPMTAVRID